MKKHWKTKKVMITGYGTVAKELVQLINNQSEELKEKYGILFQITGIIGSKGMIYEEDGIKLDLLLPYGIGSSALAQYAKARGIALTNPTFSGDVLIECSPTNLENGGAALQYIQQAIDAQMNIVSVSKGALVLALPELQEKANAASLQIKYSGATAAALPTMDIGEFSLAGCEITSIEGILNGTSNFILTSMLEEKLPYVEALKVAQERGIAESNPSLDVEGYDSACKILLLANGLLHAESTLQDVDIKGIQGVSIDHIAQAKANNQEIKLIAKAEYTPAKTVRITVSPESIAADHPLAQVKGTNKGILFNTVQMGAICCTGGASHPRGAAAAALKDTINLYR